MRRQFNPGSRHHQKILFRQDFLKSFFAFSAIAVMDAGVLRFILYHPFYTPMTSPLSRVITFFSVAGASLVIGSVALAANQPARALTTGAPQRFASCWALKTRIAASRQGTIGYSGMMVKRGMPTAMPIAAMDTAVSAGMAEASAPSKASADAFTTTNVQVEGVDEADIIKQDGDYVYHLSKNRLAISKVNPATEAKLVSITDAFDGFLPQDMYIDGNRLVLIGGGWDTSPYPEPVPLIGRTVSSKMMPIWRGRNLTRVQIFDISDRSKIKQVRALDFDGSISSTRLINGKVYAVMNSWSNWNEGEALNSNNLVPNYKDTKAGNVTRPMLPCGNVGYFDRGNSDQFLAIASIPTSGTGDIQRAVILGSSETVYATQDSIYVVRQDWNQPRPWLVDSLTPSTREQSQVYAFTLSNGAVRFRAKTNVPGHALNQFSLDEYNNVLRIATTDGQAWDNSHPSTSAVYTFDATNLKQKGAVTGIAPGEQIYSIRFVGPRAYMVTFKKIDPFFVIDLADATKPKILGKLKIPGYSDYLHPMDATHIIGIGKNAVDAPETSFAWYQGLKIAVFDVSNVEQPKELWKTEIGDRGSDSPALHDHHAFLYDASRQLLALPITENTLSAEQKASNNGSAYGDVSFQGAYAYRLTVEKGFELLGKISHVEDNQSYLKSSGWFADPDHAIERILLNRDTIITASPSQLQLHHVPDLSGYKAIMYPSIPQTVYPMMYE